MLCSASVSCLRAHIYHVTGPEAGVWGLGSRVCRARVGTEGPRSCRARSTEDNWRTQVWLLQFTQSIVSLMLSAQHRLYKAGILCARYPADPGEMASLSFIRQHQNLPARQDVEPLTRTLAPAEYHRPTPFEIFWYGPRTSVRILDFSSIGHCWEYTPYWKYIIRAPLPLHVHVYLSVSVGSSPSDMVQGELIEIRRISVSIGRLLGTPSDYR